VTNFTKKERTLAEQFNRYLLASFRAIGEIKGGSKTHQAILLSTVDRMLETSAEASVLNPLKEFTKGLLDQAHLESPQGILELEKVLFQAKNLIQNFAHFLNFDLETNKRKDLDL
jgi:hypothetical protein